MNIGFIGAGKVGMSLGKYFTGGGLKVKGYYSKSGDSAKEAADFTASSKFDNIEDLIEACDVIFLTVPDGSITGVWQQIRKYEIKGKIICHCSGAMSSEDAFEDIENTGAFGYSVHPLFAVSDKYNAYRELEDVFFTLEGKTPQSEFAEEYRDQASSNLCMIKETIEALGNPTRIIESGCKTTYHCAAAMASNLVCGLINQSIELMTRCGFTEDEAIKALAPILTGNMAHIAKVGPTESLTGPIERNDVATVKKHLDCLEDDSEKELYRLLSCRLVQMAQQRHPDRDYAGMSEDLRKER